MFKCCPLIILQPVVACSNRNTLMQHNVLCSANNGTSERERNNEELTNFEQFLSLSFIPSFVQYLYYAKIIYPQAHLVMECSYNRLYKLQMISGSAQSTRQTGRPFCLSCTYILTFTDLPNFPVLCITFWLFTPSGCLTNLKSCPLWQIGN